MTTLSVARTITRYLCVTLFISLFSATFAGQFPGAAPAGAQMPGGQAPYNAKDDPFSPENIAQVAEEIGKLSPEQQEQLYKESLDFLSKELNLAPEEVEKMIMEEFTQGATPTAEMPQPSSSIALTPQEPEKKAPVIEEKAAPIKDLNDLATLLKNIAEETDSILRKTSGLPDLPVRVERWLEQKKLPSWQSSLTWARFKQQLELLIQKLGKLQTKDKKTDTYIYLAELLENLALKNNLERIYTTLKRHNATFTVSTLDIDTAFDDPLAGAGSLSTEAKKALLGILNTYGEAFYTNYIFKDFDALIQKFEPAAKKLRTEEEESAKKALEASKKQRPTGSIKEAGRRASSSGNDYYYGGGSDSYYPDYSYSPSSYSYGSQPSYSSYGNGKKSSDGGSKGSSGKAGSKEKSSKPEEKTELKETKKDEALLERIKMIKDEGKEIAKDVRNFSSKAKNFSADNLDVVLKKDTTLDSSLTEDLKTLSLDAQKIVSRINTLNNLSKNVSKKAKTTAFAPIKATFSTEKKELMDLVKKLENLASQQESKNAPLQKAAKSAINQAQSLEKEYTSLKADASLNEEQTTNIAALTKRPLASVSKQEAQDLLAAFKDEQQAVLTPDVLTINLKGLSKNINKLNEIIIDLP